jgi:peroxiredoxin Q/BCP
MIEVGKKAPDFKLISDKGKEVSLKDYLGKKVILYFYPKDNTPGCTKEACDFTENLNILKNKNTVVIGISKDSIESHIKFKNKYNLRIDLLSDESVEVMKKYEVWKEKSLYGKKFMGIERSTFIIDEKGKIKSIFRKVKVDGHIQEILKELKKII